jgi:hypothetical protein
MAACQAENEHRGRRKRYGWDKNRYLETQPNHYSSNNADYRKSQHIALPKNRSDPESKRLRFHPNV